MARRNTLIAGLLVAVLLGHGVVLEWLAGQAQGQAALRQMAVPMLTRLLHAEAPPPVIAKAAERPKPLAAPRLRTIARSTPAQPTTTAAPPQPTSEVAASEPLAPQPEPEPAPAPAAAIQEQPQEAASAPPTVAAGSVPAGDTATAALDSWPVDTRLSYRVGGYYRGELHGTARVEWLRDGERYQTRIDIDLGLVSVVMTSQGQVRDKELVPSAYEESRIGKRRSVRMQDRIVLSDGNQVPRPAGVQDTASQFVDLSHRFSSGQLPLEVGGIVSFWMARPGGVDFWTYDVVEKETLQTPRLGPVEAFHLKPRPIENARGSITAEMWFAPALQYLPVRIKVTAADAHLDLMVDQIEQR